MSVSARLELDHLLGGSVQSLGLLSDAECSELLEAVRKLRVRERAELSHDIEAALGGFPKIFRRSLMNVFFGPEAFR